MRKEEAQDDISGQQIKRLLFDLMALSGQEAASRPALELLIGDILTQTSVEPEGQDLYLCVTGLLPPCQTHTAPAAVLASALDEAERAGADLLWHADRGRYIVVRRIPLRRVASERDVMDQILDTADMAQRCAAEIGIK